MAFTPLNVENAIEGGAGGGLLPAGAYVCKITEAHVTQSKKGQIALVLTWDVAEGPQADFFAGSQYGHTEWLMLEGNAAPYTTHKLKVIGESNTQPPITFDAVGTANQYAAAYDNGGRIGQADAGMFAGRYVGLLVGTEDSLYKGEVRQRNTVVRWLTPAEVRAGKTADGKQITVPRHKALATGQAPQAQAQAANAQLADEDIPF